MSAPQDVLFQQRILACSGYYSGALDGRWGSQSEAAETLFNTFFKTKAGELGQFDPRSEAVIVTLLPVAQVLARKFMNTARAFNGIVKLLSGTRTYAEQDALFAKVPRVTKARGGQSNHNFGIAWDVGIFVNGQYYTGATAAQEKAYGDLAVLIKANIPGLEWGGDWTSFKDQPHYQVGTGKSVDEVRGLFESGKSYV